MCAKFSLVEIIAFVLLKLLTLKTQLVTVLIYTNATFFESLFLPKSKYKLRVVEIVACVI